MRHLNLSIYIIFAFTVIIILLNRFTPFYIADYRVHFFFLFFAASSFMIIIGHLFKKLRSHQSILFTFIIVGTLCLLKAFFTWDGDWKTQTLLYRNTSDKNKTINYQLSTKRFAFGYKERIVAIYKVMQFIEWTTDIDTLYIDKSKWEKMDLKLNEMQFPKEN